MARLRFGRHRSDMDARNEKFSLENLSTRLGGKYPKLAAWHARVEWKVGFGCDVLLDCGIGRNDCWPENFGNVLSDFLIFKLRHPPKPERDVLSRGLNRFFQSVRR